MNHDGPPRIANGFFGGGGGQTPRRPTDRPRPSDRQRPVPRRNRSSDPTRPGSARRRPGTARGSARRRSSGRQRQTESPDPTPPRSRIRPRRVVVESKTARRSPRRRRTGRRRVGTPNPGRTYLGIGAVFGLLVVLTVGKLTDVQVLSPERYRDTGVAQRTVRVVLPSGRGAILDRNGDDLAVSVPRSTVVADPTQVSDVQAEAALLAEILDRDTGELEEELGRSSRFVYLRRLASDDQVERIEQEKAAGNLDGIDLIAEYERIRPDGDQTGALVGLTDIDGLGITGLEQQYDDVLQGTPGEVSYERSSLGPIPGGERELTAAAPGDDLELTIDLPLQYAVSKLVAEQVEATDSEAGTAIVSRPGTGEILSMVNVERDPDTEEVVIGATNKALTAVFEPGSVSKVITVAAALAAGEVDPATVLDHPPSLTLGGAEFIEADPLPERLSVTDILTVSSNIGTILLAQQVGAEGIDAAIRDFGFGQRTALDFPNESPGLLLPLSEWSGSSIGSIPIGQGISVTAMQMLHAYNIIAADGVSVPARLVGATIDPDGRRIPASSEEGEQVIPVEVARQVRGMLANVVSTGTGTKAAVPGYRVAGKTGTARKPMDGHPGDDGYMGADGRYHYVSTFVGMLPADDPQLSIIVVLDEPGRSGSYYASDTAAPLFSRIATEAVRRLHLPPTKGPDITAGLPELNPELRAAAEAPEPGPDPEAPPPIADQVTVMPEHGTDVPPEPDQEAG